MRKFVEIFTGDKGELSSKRFVGILGALLLFVKLFVSPSKEIIEAVEWIVILALGFTTIEKFKKHENKHDSI